MTTTRAMEPERLAALLAGEAAPVVLDVRRRAAFEASGRLLPGARWRDPARTREWSRLLPADAAVVVHCVHGHQVSQSVASTLRAQGHAAVHLAGGIEAWVARGAPTLARAALPAAWEDGPTRWVAGERPGVDALGAAWLVRRLVDRGAELHFVAHEQVAAVAAEMDGEALQPAGGVADAAPRGTAVEGLLQRFDLHDPALDRLAGMLRAASPAAGDARARRAATGPAVVLHGLARLHADDLALVERALAVLDALYAWCRAPATARVAA